MMAIRAYLANPWETALLVALAAAGLAAPPAFVAAAVLFCAAEIAAGLRGSSGPRWLPAAWPREVRPLTILYDATCGLCARSRRRLETWPTSSAMTFVPVASAEARALVSGRSEEELLGAMHVLEDGRVWSGADGWYRIMRLGPLWGAALAAVTPRALARPVYAFIARHRYRWFGSVCDDGACPVHPRPHH